MHDISFGCCLEESLRGTNIEDIKQLYSITKHCAVFLNETKSKSDAFLAEVIEFYRFDVKNVSESCSICNESTRPLFVAYVVFWVCAFFVGLIGNIFVLVAFNRSINLKKSPSTNFVASLAVSDLLVVFFLIPYKAYIAAHNHRFCAPPIICQLYLASDVTFFVASITHLFAIAVDRFIAVTRPYKYKSLATLSCTKKVIVSIWIYSSIWGVISNVNFKKGTFNSIAETASHLCITSSGMDTIILYSVVFFIPCFSMFVLYSKMLLISYKHAKCINTTQVSSIEALSTQVSSIEAFLRQTTFGISQNFFTNHKLELRATKVVLVIYGTFFVCWCPVIIFGIANAIKKNAVKSTIAYVLFGEMLPIINSILNPFIYGVLHRDFKKSLKRIFKGMSSQLQDTLLPKQLSIKSQSSLVRSERVRINEVSK